MNDSVIHAFYSCNWNQFFFLEVIKWYNKENVTSFSLSPTELMFGKKADTSSKESNIISKFNSTFLNAIYYLYNQKLIHDELAVNEFIANLKHKFISKNSLYSRSDADRNVKYIFFAAVAVFCTIKLLCYLLVFICQLTFFHGG